MKFMLGTKGRMTQVFDEAGVVRAATVITAGPLTVTQLKTKENDGYVAAQIGFAPAKETKVNNAQKGKPFKELREFTPADGAQLEAGQSIDISMFTPGD